MRRVSATNNSFCDEALRERRVSHWNVSSNSIRGTVRVAQCFGDALDTDGDRRFAQRDFKLEVTSPDVVEGLAQRLFQSVVKEFRLPEVALQILGPFEVGGDNAARVGEDVGHHRDAPTRENRSPSPVVGPFAASTTIDADIDLAMSWSITPPRAAGIAMSLAR